jgi:hypothetical protein
MKLIQLKIKENVTARTIHTIEKHSVEIEITFTNNLPTCHLKRKRASYMFTVAVAHSIRVGICFAILNRREQTI